VTTPYRPDNPFAGNGRYRSDNPFAAEPPPSVMGSVALPTVGKAARDATVAPFRNLDESGAAYDALQRTNIQDAKGVAATALQGATFNLADDVLPIKGSVEYLKRRSPTVAAGVNLASGLAMLGASVVAGLLWDRLGSSFTFYTGTLFCLVAIIGIALSPATPAQQTGSPGGHPGTK